MGIYKRETAHVDIVGGTGKGTRSVKRLRNLHSKDSQEHSVWKVRTALSDAVCLFVALGKE
jgi:hypothetical protein